MLDQAGITVAAPGRVRDAVIDRVDHNNAPNVISTIGKLVTLVEFPEFGIPIHLAGHVINWLTATGQPANEATL